MLTDSGRRIQIVPAWTDGALCAAGSFDPLLGSIPGKFADMSLRIAVRIGRVDGLHRRRRGTQRYCDLWAPPSAGSPVYALGNNSWIRRPNSAKVSS